MRPSIAGIFHNSMPCVPPNKLQQGQACQDACQSLRPLSRTSNVSSSTCCMGSEGEAFFVFVFVFVDLKTLVLLSFSLQTSLPSPRIENPGPLFDFDGVQFVEGRVHFVGGGGYPC